MFVVFFCLTYGGADLLVQLVPYRISLPHWTWPFYPQTAIIYLSMNLMLLILFLRLPLEKLCRLTAALISQTLIALPIFVLFPAEPIAVESVEIPPLFRLADLINLDNNYFPSLHVAYATTCALSAGSALWWVWTAAVTASTLLCHQHYLVDAVAGFLLALVCWAFWNGRRPMSWALLELLRCSLRHPRYAVITLGLMVVSVAAPTKGRRAILGFSYLQHLDDLLDGHLKSEEEPEKVARRQIDQWQKAKFGAESLDRAAESLHKETIPADKVSALIEEMTLDRVRVRDRRLLSEEELLTHLNRTFELSFDLMLWAAGSTHEGKDSPALLSLLGWCSLYRDFEDDLRLGLVNLPAEVVKTDTAYEWLMEQTETARSNYRAADLEISRLQPGSSLFKLFHRSVKRYIQAADSNRLLALSKQVGELQLGTCYVP